jgi:peroxiredoxin
MIFDPMANKDDIKCFAAVATSLNNTYPHADRSRNLYNMVIKGMKNTRTPREEVLELPVDKIKEVGLIDIELKDLKGNVCRLSDLMNNVVLVDFTVYNHVQAASHNLALRELYNKYHAKGLEIYQISLDTDEHFWKTSADKLPWICVRDANGIYSQYVTLYSVKSIPAAFLVGRDNVLKARVETVPDLEAAIKNLL